MLCKKCKYSLKIWKKNSYFILSLIRDIETERKQKLEKKLNKMESIFCLNKITNIPKQATKRFLKCTVT
jgi:hypothetical protein